MNKTETYLFFDGNCAEAMTFYEHALGGTLRTVPVKDARRIRGRPATSTGSCTRGSTPMVRLSWRPIG